jgi:hypothetical protein
VIYAVFKELERLLKIVEAEFSVTRAIVLKNEHLSDNCIPARIKNLLNYTAKTNRGTTETYFCYHENLAWVSHCTKQVTFSSV